ncbi:hypothetical protein PI95_016715 [Hassallia byssoidea VB512170]|uniref:Uncharacterized protein n=1 Tax=Hassallia byssoidea VB512170 TaxID=1304833 RepID=A0A846H9Y1_9CYAN|nr:hypothetical protein [Hassalia byssoidea VB512170]
METSLRIASAIVFCIGSALIIPKVADATAVLNSLAVNSVRVIESNSQTLNTTNLNIESSSDIYEPPNNGSPDSQHGTGTR